MKVENIGPYEIAVLVETYLDYNGLVQGRSLNDEHKLICTRVIHGEPQFGDEEFLLKEYKQFVLDNCFTKSGKLNWFYRRNTNLKGDL